MNQKSESKLQSWSDMFAEVSTDWLFGDYASEAMGWSLALPKLHYYTNTLQWVELIGTPTFEATSTVRALITSMQNPL